MKILFLISLLGIFTQAHAASHPTIDRLVSLTQDRKGSLMADCLHRDVYAYRMFHQSCNRVLAQFETLDNEDASKSQLQILSDEFVTHSEDETAISNLFDKEMQALTLQRAQADSDISIDVMMIRGALADHDDHLLSDPQPYVKTIISAVKNIQQTIKNNTGLEF